MSNFLKIAVIAASPLKLNGRPADGGRVENMVSYWNGKARQVLPDGPDLILVPECSDRYLDMEREDLMAYYELRGERLGEFWRETAREHNCCIGYSAVRKTDEGFVNATEIIDRGGESAGMYVKNYPTTTELEGGIVPGTRAPLIDCGFGKLACVICFDLNFDELRLRYAAAKPDLVLFSSMYHGGLMQGYWAYSCRAHFAGAIAEAACFGSVISPVGELLAETTNYHDSVVYTVNLDCGVYHMDFNKAKFPEIKKKYGPDVSISDPGRLASVLISAEAEGLDMGRIQAEFELEPLSDYLDRAAAARNSRAGTRG